MHAKKGTILCLRFWAQVSNFPWIVDIRFYTV